MNRNNKLLIQSFKEYTVSNWGKCWQCLQNACVAGIHFIHLQLQQTTGQLDNWDNQVLHLLPNCTMSALHIITPSARQKCHLIGLFFYYLQNSSKIRPCLFSWCINCHVCLCHNQGSFYGLLQKSVHSLQKNTTVRFLAETRKVEHITSVLVLLHWLCHFELISRCYC